MACEGAGVPACAGNAQADTDINPASFFRIAMSNLLTKDMTGNFTVSMTQ
ncbi:hypothetical protein AA101099_2721 [Neoasaia chiangmaiensis NBRC 101099]|nr:hypothetical protein AA101099_2721 [Neoasaia chiangmaiensis NBRC 101099]GEN14202.1 hypothetical protein NCH01_06330 [Neoasaia chiangmaiensis]